ncbi:glycosyltransferase [Enterobacter quasiroggenkampii]|uniref:glycosyltransferase n=1 Tax=Enterobacter quasiroggenkampii TaxID=2497436 RepID=UPI0021D3E5A5|nr:glycosyltransferase [Enterobacter quasiroggenkampii]MCU6278380.1 glycosyltransferase [Enterobacter quasiroggenkampii]
MKVAMLIVTYNRLPQLRRTLARTLAQGFYTVMVVNNASTDCTLTWLAQQHDPRLQIVNLTHNTGGAGGFSAGLATLAHQPDWTHVCLADDDAWPAGNWLEALSLEPDADAYCSDVRRPNGLPCIMNLPFTRIPSTLRQTLNYALNPAAFRPEGRRTRVESLTFVGACIRREWLAQLRAGLDERLFLYYDDLSAGAAMSRQGARIIWSPALRYIHDIPENVPVSARKRYYLTRNLLWLHHSRAGSPWSRSVTLLRLVLQFSAALRDHPRLAAMGAWAAGIRDGMNFGTLRKKG